jgi:hypothetical protein
MPSAADGLAGAAPAGPGQIRSRNLTFSLLAFGGTFRVLDSEHDLEIHR